MSVSIFLNLEATVQRLAFHGCKISVRKCEFAKSKILFLGWVICRDYIIADPRRVNKVREFKFPDCKKACRAFLGLVNSLRRVISMDVVSQMAILTPLTSTKVQFEPEENIRNSLHLRFHANHIISTICGQPDSPVEGIAPNATVINIPIAYGNDDFINPLNLSRAISTAIEQEVNKIFFSKMPF